MTTPEEMVGRRIKARRILLGWDQNELAKRSGVAQEHISRYERGAFRHLDLRKLKQIAQALQVRSEELVRDDEGLDSEFLPVGPAVVG